MKPVFGFNNEAQNWLQFSAFFVHKRDLASGHLQASDRSKISPWRPQQESQPSDRQSKIQDTDGQGDGCGGRTSASAHTRPCCRWTGPTSASNSAGQLSCGPLLEVRKAMWEHTHQQQLQVTVAHVHFLASHSGPRTGFRFRIQISRIYSSKACDI